MIKRAAICLTVIAITAIALILEPKVSYAKAKPGFSEDNISSYILNNGLTLILKQDRRSPTFCATIFIRTGSATEGEYAGSGITHLIEHLIFKGTATRNAQQIESQIKSLGADINAYTTFDYTAFKINGTKENILAILDIFYDIIANTQVNREDFEKEKLVVKKEFGFMQDDPEKFLGRNFWQTAYVAHPYRDPIIGYEELLEALTAEDIRSYYNRYYIPNNMVLVITGDIDTQNIKEKIDLTFGKLKRKSFSLPILPQEPLQLTPRYKEIPYAIAKTHMIMGFHSVGLTDPDLYALDTLAMILGEGRSSILYQDLHNKLNLVYGISAQNYTPFNPGLFLISATFDPDNKDKVIEEIFNRIEDIKNSPLKNKELEKAKKQLISSYLFYRQTQEAQADDLGVSQLLTGDMDFSIDYLRGIESVTPHDIMDAAKKYLAKEKMTSVFLVPSNISEKQITATATVSAPRNIVKKTLRNGIRLLICEDKTIPIISVRICAIGGLRAEDRDNNGISNIMANMLTKGAAKRSEEDLFALIESLGGSLSAYSANNSFGINLDIMSQDFEEGVEILADLALNPVFDNNKLANLKKDMLAQIELLDNDIFFATEKNLRADLFKDHPYGMVSFGTKDSVEKIKRKDIVDFYNKYCVGSNIVISICGDVDSEKALRLVASKFNGIKNRLAPAVKDIKPAAIPDRIEIKNVMDKEQAVVMVGFRSAGLSNPDRYPLQILSSIFSGGSGRLYTNIRQDKAMAYTLGTFGMIGIDAGSFIFYAATRPEDLDSVKDEIIKQIKRVCDGDITDEEISSAKKSLVAKHRLNQQSVGTFAAETALDELYGLGYDNYARYPENISKVSREELIQAANKYFTLKNCVISTTVPKK